MFDAAAHYVAETMARLPNFLATRTTNRFDDSPQELKKGAWRSVRGCPSGPIEPGSLGSCRWENDFPATGLLSGRIGRD